MEKFAVEARRYVEWAAGTTDERMDAATALRRIAAVYSAALHLPNPFSANALDDDDAKRVSSNETRLVYEKASELPFKYYDKAFDPLAVPTEESVGGDIADDIADIYQEVATGLRFFEAGEVAEALWEWGFGFRIHWGEHATRAIRALHAYLAQEDLDGLTGGSD